MKEEQMSKEVNLSRRSFLKGAALAGAAGVGAAALVGCASDSASSTEGTAYLPSSWDAEADMIIVGFGAGGLGAGITATNDGLGSCIILEAAPEGEEGGNSRVCGQNLLIPDDIDEGVTYMDALCGPYPLSSDRSEHLALIKAWATALHENKEWLEGLGANVTATSMNSHEFPELEGNEKGATCYLIDNTVGQSAFWNFLKETSDSLGIDVRYGTRAVKLVRNPLTNECLGVEATTEGDTTLYFKAKKGVLLACGGFENNFEMAKAYAPSGIYWDAFYGTPYNRGDGFKMVAPFGAQLWNMNSMPGPSFGHSLNGEDSPHCWMGSFTTKDYIYVGPNGKRIASEEWLNGTTRHGKHNINGVYQCFPFNTPSYVVFGQDAFDSYAITEVGMSWATLIKGYIANDAAGLLEKGVIAKADTIEALAEKIGYDPAILAETITTYNGYAAAGFDPDYHRGEDIYETNALVSAQGLNKEGATQAEAGIPGFPLVPINGPYYAMKLRVSIGANTQGGPKRDVNANIVDVDNNPIPRLYGAGEFGPIYSYMYNGGGNVSEALAYGRLAARSIGALKPWDAGAE
jgi:hypothetical protein